MKRILFVTLLVVVLAPAAWAQAPFVPSFEVSLGGGLNIPLGDLGDGMNKGYNLNASVGYSVLPMVVVGAEFGYFGNGGSDETIAALGPGGDFSTTAQQFTAMAKYVLPVAVHSLYAKGLVGAYRMSSNVKSSLGELSASDTNFGFGIGAGFQFKGWTKYSIYAEGIYHRISGETTDGEYATINLGVLLSLD